MLITQRAVSAGGVPEPSHGMSTVGVFVMVACLLMVGGALGVLGYHSYLKTPRNADAEYDGSGGGYIPMSSTEEYIEPQRAGGAGPHPV